MMMRTLSIGFIAMLLAPVAWAQPLAPSLSPAPEGGRAFHKSLPAVRMGLAIDLGNRLGDGELPETTIDLSVVVDGHERVMSSSRLSSRADVDALVKAGAVT